MVYVGLNSDALCLCTYQCCFTASSKPCGYFRFVLDFIFFLLRQTLTELVLNKKKRGIFLSAIRNKLVFDTGFRQVCQNKADNAVQNGGKEAAVVS